MGFQRSDQRLQLIAAGVASAGLEWRGGEGVATLTGTTFPSGGVHMQMSPNNGVSWINIHIYGADIGQHVEWTSVFRAFNFKLPACRLRADAAASGMELLAVSV